MKTIVTALGLSAALASAPAMAATTITAASGEGSHTDAFEGAPVSTVSALYPGSSALDAVGGSFSDVEPGHTIFADNNFVNFIVFDLGRIVPIEKIVILLADDSNTGSENRGTYFLQPQAGTAPNLITPIGFVPITPNYLASYGSSEIAITLTFDTPLMYRYYGFGVLAQTGLGPRVIEFDGFAANVPEPATWAMMIGGMGVVGGALRTRTRRRSAIA